MTVRLPNATFTDDKSGRATWGRAVVDALRGLITNKQDANANLTSIAGLSLTGNSGDAIVVKATEDGFELVAGGGGGGTTTNALTINNGGAGAASGATFNGSAPVTISYNTVGAAASSHTHAQADVTGLTTADSPQFAGINLGHASDTTLTRVSAGVVAIEGVNAVTTAGGVTFAADISVPDEAYDATTWNGNNEAPTKNAIRDKIESLAAPVLISEQVATGVEHSITFSSIPNTYRSLKLEIFGRTDEAVTFSPFTLTCNNDSSAIYDIQRQFAQSTTNTADQSLSSAGWTTLPGLPGSSAAANHAGRVTIEFTNYKDTVFYKDMVFRGRQMNSTTTGNGYVMHGTGGYRSTSAISRLDITITTAAKVFITGSTFRLYGIP